MLELSSGGGAPYQCRLEVSEAGYVDLTHEWLSRVHLKELVVILTDETEQAHLQRVDVVVGKPRPSIARLIAVARALAKRWRAVQPVEPHTLGRVRKDDLAGCLLLQIALGRAHLPLKVAALVVLDAAKHVEYVEVVLVATPFTESFDVLIVAQQRWGVSRLKEAVVLVGAFVPIRRAAVSPSQQVAKVGLRVLHLRAIESVPVPACDVALVILPPRLDPPHLPEEVAALPHETVASHRRELIWIRRTDRRPRRARWSVAIATAEAPIVAKAAVAVAHRDIAVAAAGVLVQGDGRTAVAVHVGAVISCAADRWMRRVRWGR